MYLTSHQVDDLRQRWDWPASAPADFPVALSEAHLAYLVAQYHAGRGDGSQSYDPRPVSDDVVGDMRRWGFVTSTGITNAGEAIYHIAVSTAQDPRPRRLAR